MKVKIQLIIEHEDESETTIVEELGCLHRDELQLENLGLQLSESKQLLAAIQQCLAREQVTDYIQKVRTCPTCGRRRSTKDNK